MELELATTKEIISELLARKTFAGIIIVSPEQHLREEQVHNCFDLFTAADVDTTIEILEHALTSIKQHGAKDEA